jgi:ATP-binding protein involved in chromosome partitioning
VQDPDLGKDIVSLGFVKRVAIDDGRVAVTVELTTPACPVKDQLRDECRTRIAALPGVRHAEVEMTAQVRRSLVSPAGGVLPGVRNTIAVASGKGGVGKSTVATNLACSLALDGSTVGLLDADIYGPSAPIMFGVHDRPKIRDEKIVPIQRHGVAVMSLGFLADERTPVIWRGPLVARMIQQFLSDVAWGELEYLVIDLPPGTGDVQLTLAQACPLSGALVVTTPQEVALEDVYRAVRMFAEVKIPILGVVENMSYFEAPDTGTRHALFGRGGGAKAAKEFGVPLLAELPIVPEVCESGDAGIPIVVRAPDSIAAGAYRTLARNTAARLSTMAMSPAAKPVEIKFRRR